MFSVSDLVEVHKEMQAERLNAGQTTKSLREFSEEWFPENLGTDYETMIEFVWYLEIQGVGVGSSPASVLSVGIEIGAELYRRAHEQEEEA